MEVTTPLPRASVSSKTDVFLSHNWGANESVHTIVRKVNEELSAAGIITWFDEERMHGDIRRKMTDGIDDTSIFMAFITDEYRKKVNSNEARDNCKYEFDYAFEQKGSRFIIPVVLEESMRNPRDWKGPLGAALGKLLYIDLCNVDINDFPEAKTKELVEAIQKKLREINHETKKHTEVVATKKNVVQVTSSHEDISLEERNMKSAMDQRKAEASRLEYLREEEAMNARLRHKREAMERDRQNQETTAGKRASTCFSEFLRCCFDAL